jgi:RNA polymerase sigma-70 factor (ECF subfamily)
MLRITEVTMDDGIPTLRIEGRLTAETAAALSASCAAAGTGAAHRLELSGVRFADRAGVRALRDAAGRGVSLVGSSAFLRELLGSEPEVRQPEAQLVERLRAGDEAAFEALVRTYGGRLLAVARRYLPNEHDARDVLQEAFLAAFRSIGSFAGGSKLSTWLHRIVVNAALMKIRSRGRRREESIDDLLPRFAEDGHHEDGVPAWETAGDVLVEREEERVTVRRAIERLPEAYRTVLLLRDIEERDTEETATLLGVSAQAVKTRLHRARQALRTLLERELVQPRRSATAVAAKASNA